MVHQRLVLKLTLETTRITDTIPRLDTDEGGLFIVWAPEGYHWCAEGDCHLRLSCLIQQLLFLSKDINYSSIIKG